MLDQAETRSPKINPAIPAGWQDRDSSTWTIICCLQGYTLARNWIWSRAATETQASNVGCGCSKWYTNCYTKFLTQLLWFFSQCFMLGSLERAGRHDNTKRTAHDVNWGHPDFPCLPHVPNTKARVDSQDLRPIQHSALQRFTALLILHFLGLQNTLQEFHPWGHWSWENFRDMPTIPAFKWTCQDTKSVMPRADISTSTLTLSIRRSQRSASSEKWKITGRA